MYSPSRFKIACMAQTLRSPRTVLLARHTLHFSLEVAQARNDAELLATRSAEVQSMALSVTEHAIAATGQDCPVLAIKQRGGLWSGAQRDRHRITLEHRHQVSHACCLRAQPGDNVNTQSGFHAKLGCCAAQLGADITVHLVCPMPAEVRAYRWVRTLWNVYQAKGWSARIACHCALHKLARPTR